MQNTHRRTWAEIDLDAIAHNYKEIRRATKAKICCVVKADAYGHGAVALAKEYEELGADYFGVSNLDEAMQLRRGGISLPILIFGYTPPRDAPILSNGNISQCVYSLDYAQALAKEAGLAGLSVNIHIKVDTGMSRLGFLYQDPARDGESIGHIRQACSLKGLIPQGIFSHFAVSDEGENSFTHKQFSCFTRLLEELKDIPFAIRHCANSGAIEDFPQTHLDMIRAGIILYGLSPSAEIRNPLNLKPALSLKSVISHIKTIESGATVSYGRQFTAAAPMKIATVPIGYADGYTRILAEKGGRLLIGGYSCSIVGRICMDQLMVDVSNVSGISMGDTVTVIGEDAGLRITAEEIAALRSSINYEVICDIGARVPRIYIKNGAECGQLNYISL